MEHAAMRRDAAERCNHRRAGRTCQPPGKARLVKAATVMQRQASGQLKDAVQNVFGEKMLWGQTQSNAPLCL